MDTRRVHLEVESTQQISFLVKWIGIEFGSDKIVSLDEEAMVKPPIGTYIFHIYL